jgi:hypothetical protein
MGFSVTAAAGAMTARPYRSLWRSSDACAARSLPPPIHSCRTLTAGMPPSQMMAASWCRTWNRFSIVDTCPPPVKTTPAIAGTTPPMLLTLVR